MTIDTESSYTHRLLKRFSETHHQALNTNSYRFSATSITIIKRTLISSYKVSIQTLIEVLMMMVFYKSTTLLEIMRLSNLKKSLEVMISEVLPNFNSISSKKTRKF